MSNLEIFNLENFVLHYNSILCFCNPRNIYHKNIESHESTKILTLEIFRLYGMLLNHSIRANTPQYTKYGFVRNGYYPFMKYSIRILRERRA